MNYQEKLSPWTIVRVLPDLQKITVARFRRRGDAEGHLVILNRMMPLAEFAIEFENREDGGWLTPQPLQEQ